MIGRLAIVGAFCLATSAYLYSADRAPIVPLRESLDGFPSSIGAWRLARVEPIEERIEQILGVDEYVNRVYTDRRRGGVSLYIGYYGSQRHGDSIHSPMNCMPGAGWQPISRSVLPIETSDVPGGAARTIEVNRFVIEKGLDRQVAIYWYQSHGRVIADEYVGRALMVWDAMRLNRTDGALVRVVAPVLEEGAAGETAADATAVSFIQTVYPLLGRFLPS